MTFLTEYSIMWSVKTVQTNHCSLKNSVNIDRPIPEGRGRGYIEMKILFIEDIQGVLEMGRELIEMTFGRWTPPDELSKIILASSYNDAMEAMDVLDPEDIVFTDICFPGPKNLSDEVIERSLPYYRFAHGSRFMGGPCEKDVTEHHGEPPLGVLIFQEGKKRGLDIRFGTRLAHGTHIVPALVAYGLITEDEAKKIKEKVRSGENHFLTENGIVLTKHDAKKDLLYFHYLFGEY